MAQTKLNMLLQVRRDDVFNKAYVLQPGEPGFEISTNTYKVGDGTTTWENLPITNEDQIKNFIVVGLAEAQKYTDEKVEGLKDYADGAFKVKQTAYSANGTTTQTITAVSQNANGEVQVTYSDIALPTEADYGVLSVNKKDGTAITVDNTDAQNPKIGLDINNSGNVVLSQTNTGLAANIDLSAYKTNNENVAQFKKIQSAVNAVSTDTNEFIDTVAQDAQGVVSISTKKVDFTGYNTDAQNEAKYKQLQTVVSAAETAANEFIDTIAQNENGEIAITTKTVDFAPIKGTDNDTEASATIKGAKKYADARKAEVVAMIDGVASAGLTRSIVEMLPNAASAALNTIYMIKRAAGLDENDVYDEYIVVEIDGVKHFELLGNTELDLSNYYTKAETDTAYKHVQTAYNADGSNKKTITNVKQNANGEVEVTYSDIDFSHDHDAQYKKLQTALNAVETETNVFVDTIAQNKNGEIEITTKAVDFTEVNNELDKKLESVVISTGDAAGQIKYSVDGGEAVNVDVNGFDSKLDAGNWSMTPSSDLEAHWDDTGVDTVLGSNGITVSTSSRDGKIRLMDPYGSEISMNIHEESDVGVEMNVSGPYQSTRIRPGGITFDPNGSSGDTSNILSIDAYGVTRNVYDYETDSIDQIQLSFPDKGGVFATNTYVHDAISRIDTGVLTVVDDGSADPDVVVTNDAGNVTVAHKAYSTGVVKDATHDSATDPSFLTSVTIENGHVTGATVQNLATVLAGMTFIFDGGNSTNV